MCLRTDLESVGARPRPYSRSGAKSQKNSEKRKEKSRDAARCRRGKESEIFTELANALPLPAQTIAQLDKASVMRLTIAFLKTRALCEAELTKKSSCLSGGDDGGKRKQAMSSECGGKLDVEMDSLLLKALDGFLLVLSTDADVIYTSENIAAFLGLPQVDVMGQCLYDYTHPCDHDEVRDLVSAKGYPQEPRHAFLRLKCTLTAKGRSVNLKSASYKVVQLSGELVRGAEDEAWFVALATPVPHPSNIEIPLDKQTFLSKHSLDMKFTYVDENVAEYCGYSEEELIGRSLYELHHALDSDLIKAAYKTLRSKGQVETGRYRFLAREGGYVWLVTQATLINGPKDHKPQYVVCLNYIVSGVEAPGEVLSELQLMCSKNTPSNKKSENKSLPSSVPVAVGRSLATPPSPKIKSETRPKAPRIAHAPPPPTPVTTTFKIFTNRTEEMNKGYVTFSEDDPTGIVFKDEPDDLTHLAPSGGDTCVPLEVPTFIPEWDDVLQLDYKQLSVTTSDVLFASPTALSGNTLDQGNTDPKYNEYELTANGSKTSQRLSAGKAGGGRLSGSVSPSSSCSSPTSAGFRTPEPPKSLLSQSLLYQSSLGNKPPLKGVETSRPRTTTESLFTQLDENAMVGDGFNKLELKLEDENMDEFFMRAPYIPLSNESLMLSQDDLMWGAPLEPLISPSGNSLSKRDKYMYLNQEDEDSSLAQMLRDVDPPIIGSDHVKDGPLNSGPQQNQYQQNKFLDIGGTFVDPNKVLPGHFGGKDGLDDSSGGGGGTVADGLPQVMMHEEVEPPPPLVSVDSQHFSLNGKRRHSPLSSPRLSHKKMCSLLYDQQQSQVLQQSPDRLMQQHQQLTPQPQMQSFGLHELTTPYAPTMQQLLISKDPITIRGGRPVGGATAPLNIHRGKDSVLRNLLNVNNGGGGERLSIGKTQDSQATSGIRMQQDRMTAMLLADGGSINANGQLSYPKLRIIMGSQGSFVQADTHQYIKVASTADGGGGKSGLESLSGEDGIKRMGRQDSLLLLDPDLSIANLLDLSQFDCEVNAPAGSSDILQGADLLNALDQNL